VLCKGEIASEQKYHITVGHQTVMATVTFMQLPPQHARKAAAAAEGATAAAAKPGADGAEGACAEPEPEAGAQGAAQEQALVARAARHASLAGAMSHDQATAEALGFDFSRE
jgi:hypothetical protein